VKIVQTCPLGSECEEAKDGKIYRCRWYIEVKGKHPQTGEDINEWDCSMAWLPTLTLEMSRTNRGQTSALESFRNEMVKGQTNFNKLMGMGLEAKMIGESK
jgi:hypothetical protein